MKIVGRFMISSGLLLAAWTALVAAPAPEAKGLRQKARLKGWPFFLVTDLAFSPDSKLLAMAGGDKRGVPLWDVASGKVAVVLPDLDCAYVRFSPGGKMLATAGIHLKIWDVASGKELARFKRKIPSREAACLRQMLFSADGRSIAAIAKGNITIYNVESKEQLRAYDIDSPPRLVSSYPAQKQPIFARCRDKGKPIQLMDPFTGKEVLVCENELELLPHNIVSDREETILAGLCRDTKDWRSPRWGVWELWLWDRRNGKKICAIPNKLYGFETFTLSPDGKILLLFAHGSRTSPHLPVEKSGLHFYEAPSGRILGFQELVGLGNYPYLPGSHTLVFSPDGRLLATAEGSTVRLWSIPEAWRKNKK